MNIGIVSHAATPEEALRDLRALVEDQIASVRSRQPGVSGVRDSAVLAGRILELEACLARFSLVTFEPRVAS